MTSLKEKVKIYPRHLLKDERGWFLKAITGKEENLPDSTGEVYFTCGLKGQRKGSHYHPKAQEWFTLITGNAILKLEDINTHERLDIKMDSMNPQTIYIPRYVAHSLECDNNCNEFILCAYTDLLYDPQDTIPYNIE